MKTTAIILAAGMGNRLKEHTTNTPKALVKIGERCFVDYAIEYAHASGADEIIVVGGYCYDQMQEAIPKIAPTATLIENKEYQLQNLVTFKTGLDVLPADRNLLVVNYDYLFHKHSTDAMKAGSQNFSVFCSFDIAGDAEDVMRVQADQDGRLVSMSKTQDQFNAIYNGYWFVTAEKISLLREVTDYLMKTVDLKTTAVEEVFREFLRRGEEVMVKDIGPSDWIEIDTPEELVVARARAGEFYQT